MSNPVKNTPAKQVQKKTAKIIKAKQGVKPKIQKQSKQKHTEKTPKEVKNIFFRDIEVNVIKEALMKEIDIAKLRESLVDDIKESLLKEIDVSALKEALTKDIIFRKEDGEIIQDEYSPITNEFEEFSDSAELSPEPAPIENNKKAKIPAYKYGLVDSFMKDHKEIYSIYEIIMSNAKDKDYATLPLMLSNFSKKLLTHFNEEEELFVYMKALAASRSDIEKRIATEFSSEMKNLSISVIDIINNSNFIPVSDNTVEGFIAEFEELANILNDRISREEKVLYPMYENSRQVVDIC